MVFVLDIIPTIKGWESDPPIEDLPYDACLKKMIVAFVFRSRCKGRRPE
jgi:hypothetical protein